MYKCPIYYIFGVPCPGCGMTRALFLLLSGDISGALHMHPLIVTMPVFISLYAFGTKRVRTYTAYVMGALFIAVYAVRMAMYFPNSEPFLFNHSSLLGFILDILAKKAV